MPTTFKAVVYADNKRQDGTYNIKIRVTHNRRTLKVSTNLYATPDSLTRSLKLKDQDHIDDTDDLIRKWRKIVQKLGTAADGMDVKQIVEHIQYIEKNGDVFKLDFIEYGREVANSKSVGTSKNYITALNALSRYIKSQSVDISVITAKFLKGFEDFLSSEPVMKRSSKRGLVSTGQSKTNGRALSLYMECLRSIHNQAKSDYNDEDNGVINIPLSPFKKYKLKKTPKARKRAVEAEVIQSIINLDNDMIRPGKMGEIVRRDLARDCFLISFGLAGMNAADLYDCPAQQFGKNERIIVYKRKKTRTRRDDQAEMHIRIEPCIWQIIQKYLDPSGERLFVFHKKYATSTTFNDALSHGLERIEHAIKSKRHITFYAARHTWATVARSDALKIDKYTVHEALNHVDSEMKNTDIYIDRDYRPIWNANAQVLGLFDWSELQGRKQGKK